MKVKCPNCNESMAVVLVWEDTDGYSTTHTREYECKCGCMFEVNYIAEEPKIIKIGLDK